MIDLHIHTNYSDGTDTVIDVLKKAEELKLDIISITDHENCNAYFALDKIDIKKYFSGIILPGIELKTQYNEKTIDVLGYGIDYKKMQNYIDEYYKDMSREKIEQLKLEEFYKIAKKLDLVVRPIEELVWDKTRQWGSIVFYDEVKAHEENKSKVPEDFWESFINFRKNYYKVKGNKFYVNMSKYYPTLEKIIDMIHLSRW